MKTFKPRTCVCGCNETFEPTGTTQRFKEGHKPAKVKSRAITKRPRKVREVLMPNPFADQRIDRLTDHVNREIGGAQDVPLHQRVDNGAGSATTERVITLQLGESKVQKLLDLLLQ